MPSAVQMRLDRIIEKEHHVVVGDANGADKAVQQYLAKRAYRNVTVYCSGDTLRNNVGHWTTQRVDTGLAERTFRFFAAKDREMAKVAEFAMMIWDGKSPGTILNVLRVIRDGKIAVVFRSSGDTCTIFRSMEDWNRFLADQDKEFVSELRDRATDKEWSGDWKVSSDEVQPNLLDMIGCETANSPNE